MTKKRTPSAHPPEKRPPGWKPHVPPKPKAKPKPRPRPESFRHKLARVARAELGTHEWPAGSNKGAVMKFLAAVGILVGAPWCAAFVTWCLKKAGYDGPLPSLPGYCPSWESFARTRHITRPKFKARVFDIGLFDFEGDGTPDHIGFVVANLGPVKLVKFLEGNTGDVGAVMYRWRLWTQICCVIDVDKLAALK